MLLLLPAWGPIAPMDDVYRSEVERWRQKREESLKADDGWLTLVGLHWLRPSTTRLGSDPSSDVVLPESAPARTGELSLSGGRASLRVEPGVVVKRDGKPFEGGEVRTDAEGKADVLAVGDIRLIVIKRGDRLALRVKDNRSPARAAFAGLKWYPVEDSWRIKARFEASTSPTRIVLDTIVGEQDSIESPGFAVFERGGKTYRLQAAREGDKLWFVFRDGTSGRTTHGGARQLSADPPDSEGNIVLDFNKAVNLPCAFTTYATCPLAPRQNRLELPITAGELKYEPAGALPKPER
jgi:uncharacterized protein (DUF1684 family)